MVIFFRDFTVDYQYWGYSDMDVLVGDLRSPVDAAVRGGIDVVTSSKNLLIGHFTILKNTEKFRLMYRECAGWQDLFCEEHYQKFDEGVFSDYVRHSAAAGTVTIAVAPMVQEDCVIFWGGRAEFVILWAKGSLLDVLAFRRYGYFHFIKTKYQSSLAASCEQTPGNFFYMTPRGFSVLQTPIDWCRFIGRVCVAFVHSVPWYCSVVGRRLRRLLSV